MSIKTIEGGLNVTNARFCVVVTRWNSFIVDSLEAGAIDTLKRQIETCRVRLRSMSPVALAT